MTETTLGKLQQQEDGFWIWRDERPAVGVCFTGRGSELERLAAQTRLAPPGFDVAWLRQVHSNLVVEARSGDCGEGDALVSRRPGLCLALVTADCVPVLLLAGEAIAAVHAGWRGITQGIVAATVARLGPQREGAIAWIGPAIGPCCYEVGEDVAQEVVAASSSDVRQPGSGRRPHLDLLAAVHVQLQQAGVETVYRSGESCTRCAADRLWSYRREGPGAGRNYALIWRPSPAAVG